ncbi:uncharacterized protein TNCV_1260721 [Trichonephila clavipes]|nr:uncharacterized protein TNCV_1260721 [Trichonephila clavipes]
MKDFLSNAEAGFSPDGMMLNLGELVSGPMPASSFDQEHHVLSEGQLRPITSLIPNGEWRISFLLKVDGTWQRRGYTSMNGCVAAISVDTGKVLDIEVMSSYCPKCKRLQTMPRNFEYESSKADHICQCNFTGSSSKMEIVGASRIFLRFEKNRRLQYTQYYGDGDPKAFMSVKDTYGLNSVTKFE